MTEDKPLFLGRASIGQRVVVIDDIRLIRWIEDTYPDHDPKDVLRGFIYDRMQQAAAMGEAALDPLLDPSAIAQEASAGATSQRSDGLVAQ